MLALLLAVQLSIAPPAADSTSVAPLPRPLVHAVRAAAAPADTVRPRAVDLSAGYERRLRMHRIGSYVMVPVFAAQYVLGSRMLDQKEDVFAGRRTTPPDARLRDGHRAVAYAAGALFAANTVTGAWNWWETRRVPEGRALRTAHALLMVAADAGIVATGIAGGRATDGNPADARDHRRLALGSVGVAAASAVMMLVLDRD